MPSDLAELRRWFAEDLRLRVPVQRNPSVVEAFATVPRERFLGPGPWRLLPHPDRPFDSPDADPRWVYHDVLVALDAARGINNGLPSLWAHVFDHLDLRPRERVLQIGAGTGYYAAVLAELVGATGAVTALEADAPLAARARVNLAPWPQVVTVAADGRTHDAGAVDAIVVCAGSTHPAPLWLDRLAEGGRLLMPLTGENRWGFMLRVVRRGAGFEASSIGPVGFIHCVGGRDADAAQRLKTALDALGGQRVPLRALHRGEPPADAGGRVWYHAPGIWLERD